MKRRYRFSRQIIFGVICIGLGSMTLFSCDQIEEELGITFVSIPGGSFEMGCSPGDGWCAPDEFPRHTVMISSFKMMACPVTQAQWEAVMGENPSFHTPDNGYEDCPDCPVEQVSWNDVQSFINELKKLNLKRYRLPTEAEREYAARAGTTTRYYCGDDPSCLDDIAWYPENSDYVTHPVGEKEPNEFGLYDMLGMVYEWCQDWYGQSYYSVSRQENPSGPATGTTRVKRGGSLGSSTGRVRVSYRYGSSPTFNNSRLGFRLCLDE